MKLKDFKVEKSLAEIFELSGRKHLSGYDLTDLELQDMQLRGAHAYETVFDGGHFRNIDFLGGDWRKARFNGARFENCTFQGSALVEVDFSKAVFIDCQLGMRRGEDQIRACKFVGATFENVSFNAALFGCDFSDVEGVISVVENSPIGHCSFVGSAVSFRKGLLNIPSRIINCDFSGADLRGEDFRRWLGLDECKFVDAKLTGANLSGLNLAGLNFQGAKLSQAKLCNCDLTETDFRNAHLGEVDWSGSNLLDAISNDPEVATVKMVLESLSQVDGIAGNKAPWNKSHLRKRP